MAISDKITSMTNHLTADYDAIESVVGEVTVNKNIENIAPLLDNLWEELPHTTGSGTELTINDTRAGKMKVQLMGNTSQTQKTGKNLLNIQTSSSSQFGITVTKNSDGTLTVNGTATADAAVIFNTTVTLAAGTYTLSGCPSGGSSSTYNLNLDQLSTMRDNGSGVTFTLNSERTSTAYVSVKSGVTLNNVIFKPMIVSGSTSGDFEPYTGKKATPNPDNPEQVHTCSGDNEVVVTGKNLYSDRFSDYTKPVNYRLCPISLKKGQKYVLSATLKGTAISGVVAAIVPYGNQYVDFSTQLKMAVDSQGYVHTLSFTPDDTWTSPKLAIYADDEETFDSLFENYDIQLEAGNSSSPYEPYQSSTYPINLPVENLFDESQLLNASGWALDSNGYYTGNVADLRTYMNNWQPITYKANTQYTFSYTSYGAITTGNGRFVITYTDSSVDNLSLGRTETPLDFSFTSDAGKTISKITVDYSSSHTIYIKDIQLEEGTKANHYTPYGTTPIEMCDINDNRDKFIRNSGKNLIPFTNQDFTLNNVRYYVSDGSLYVNGNSTGETSTSNQNFKDNFSFTLEAGTYTLQCSTKLAVYLKKYSDNSNIFSNPSWVTTGRSFTLTEETKLYLGFYVYQLSFNNDNLQIQINEGDTALPYEPYGSGEWYLEKKSAKTQVSLGGTVYDIGIYKGSICQPPNKAGLYNGTAYCSKSLIATTAEERVENRFYENPANFMFIGSSTDTATTLKEKFDGSDLYYVLSSPTYTKIEGTLKDELEDVWRASSYKGQTNIIQINNDLPFELSVTALEG